MLSILLGNLSLWDSEKIVVDFWLAMIEIFWLMGVLFVGSQLLFNEINWKTIFLILSKPIKRYEFILWKFLWFSFVVSVVMLVQSILFLAVLMFKWIPIDLLIVFSLFFTFLKLEIILALVLFLSTFMSNMLTIVVTFISYIIWSSFSIVQDLVSKWGNEVLIWFARFIWTLFPPFESLNLKDMIWGLVEVNATFFLLNTMSSLTYLWLILFLTVVLFNIKKFER